MGDEKDQWYTNKELFNLIISLQEKMVSLDKAMSDTRILIEKYNGLRTVMSDLCIRVNSLEENKKTNKVWIVGVIGAIPVIIALAYILKEWVL